MEGSGGREDWALYAHNVCRSYGRGRSKANVLQNFSLRLPRG